MISQICNARVRASQQVPSQYHHGDTITITSPYHHRRPGTKHSYTTLNFQAQYLHEGHTCDDGVMEETMKKLAGDTAARLHDNDNEATAKMAEEQV